MYDLEWKKKNLTNLTKLNWKTFNIFHWLTQLNLFIPSFCPLLY